LNSSPITPFSCTTWGVLPFVPASERERRVYKNAAASINKRFLSAALPFFVRVTS
jgi:hypothetical protein